MSLLEAHPTRALILCRS